jgi:hypothetical protein
MRWSLCLLAACLLLHAAVARGGEPVPGARLSGRIFERASIVPIAGAIVFVQDGPSATSDAEGRFSLDLTPGTVELTVTAAGYEPARFTEKLAPNVARTVEYRLLPRDDKNRYTSRVVGAAHHEGDSFTVRDEELLKLPGTSGDPFRVIGSLPGVIAPIPLLPIYVVRGGSPGMNGFFLDGMRVPQLFHLVLVDGVVHPRILDHIDFYPGSYDATFGRYGSGIVDAGTRPARNDAPYHGDLELRLFDVSALAETRIPGGVTVLAAGRYGFPGPLIHLLAPGVDVSYWDYQLRVDWRGLTLEALGSFDSLAISTAQPDGSQAVSAQFMVEFHRIQLREQYRRGRFDLEAALVGGLDRMSIFSGEGVQKLGLSARLNLRYKLPFLALAVGADSEISQFAADHFSTDQTRAAPDELGDLSGNRNGIIAGAYAQGTLSLDRWLHMPLAITAGLRADVYNANGVTLLGLDPRVVVRFSPLPQLEIFGGFGQYTQAPSFPVPLPGIDTFALQLGLQKNVQGSVGIRVKLPESITASATGYYGRFTNINDVVIDFEAAACTSPPPESIKGLAAYVTRQTNGSGYGLELLVRKQAGRVGGWISYTLSRSERLYSCGLGPSDFDQTHVLNAVAQVRLPWHLMVGFKFNVQTGRPYTLLQADLASATFSGTRNNQRLPTYVQLDLRVDREWVFRRWAMALFIELLNLTYSESIYGVTYPKDPMLMITRYDQPQFQGFRWILPSIGARGRF